MHTCSSPCLYQKKKKKLFTLCCMCQASITIQQIGQEMIENDLYRGPPCKISIVVMIEMNKEFRTYATDTGTQDLQEQITEYKH